MIQIRLKIGIIFDDRQSASTPKWSGKGFIEGLPVIEPMGWEAAIFFSAFFPFFPPLIFAFLITDRWFISSI